MLYIPLLQPLVEWLTNLIVRFAQWLNGIPLPFGLDPIWMFCGILVFGGAIFPLVAGLIVVALREQARSALLSQMQNGLGWCREPVYGLKQTNIILYSLNVMDGSNLKNLINAFLLKMVYDGRRASVAVDWRVDCRSMKGNYDVAARDDERGSKRANASNRDFRRWNIRIGERLAVARARARNRIGDLGEERTSRRRDRHENRRRLSV